MQSLVVHILSASAVLFVNIAPALASDLARSAPVISSTAASVAEPAATARQATGYYLTGEERVFTTFPIAPRLNSDRDHMDLLITLTVQSSRNADQVQEAKNDRRYSDAVKALHHIVNPAFETVYPETSEVTRLVKHVNDDGAMIMRALKKKNGRPRPYVQHPGLVIPLFTVVDFSYPSGHALGSELQARLLSELFPDHAPALLEKAKVIAASRVVAGVHYESDIEAGLQLGDLIFCALKENPKFVHDLDAAKAEIGKK